MNGDKQGELVVILHGIGMNTLRMTYLSHRLSRAGYTTLNLGYPSTRRTIESCAEFVAQKLQHSRFANYDKIHFVAHSMGGLVTMQLLAWDQIKASRAVLIAPPHAGSEVADLLQDSPLYKRFFGPAGQQLTTAYRKDISYLLGPSVEFGVISGTRGWEYPWFLSTMKQTGSHDGLVSLNSTRIPGAKDHITIRMSHSFLIETCSAEAIHFLGHGRFRQNAIRPFELAPRPEHSF